MQPKAKKQARCIRARDAVIIGVLSNLASRQRALVSLKVGIHIRKNGAEWILHQTKDITKERNQIILPLSLGVGLMLERYLEVERQELLSGRNVGSLWEGLHGTPLSASGIVNML